MLTPQIKALVELMADTYEGKFTLVPRMIYDAFAAQWGSGEKDIILKDDETLLQQARPLPLLGKVRTECVASVLLVEWKPSADLPVTMTEVSLVEGVPILDHRLRVVSHSLIQATLREIELSEGQNRNYCLRRSCHLRLGDSVKGIDIMQSGFDPWHWVKEFETLVSVARQFEVLVPRIASASAA